MKRKLTTVIALGMSAVAWSASCVVVEQTNGDKSEFLLSTSPEIRYVQNAITLTTTETEIVFAASDVRKAYISESTSSQGNDVELIQQESVSYSITINDATVSIRGMKENETVSLFSIDGKLLCTAKADADGKVEVSLREYTKGVYVVKVGNQTFKIVRL